MQSAAIFQRVTRCKAVAVCLLLSVAPPGWAQSPPAVQIVEGHIEARDLVAYSAADLRKGDILHIHAVGTSGSLDPAVALTDDSRSVTDLVRDIESVQDQAMAQDRDLDQAEKDTAERLLLAWDDDSGPGYSARTTVTIPRDGTYRILLSGGLGLFDVADAARVTQGGYRLTVGLNTPIAAHAAQQGRSFLDLDLAHLRASSVQRIAAQVTPERPAVEYRLHRLHAGDLLSARLEGGPGHAAPRLRLLDFGGKELHIANPNRDESSATIEYAAIAETSGLLLSVEGREDATTPYALLVGRNAPEVLTGAAIPGGEPIIWPPIEVHVGVELEQITGVNQQQENFGAVASIHMQWHDPRFAFSPDACECRRKIFTETGFEGFIAERNVGWPQFVITNQQGPRWSQRKLFEVEADGTVLYRERFTTDLQAPEFDFRRFPLDKQEFFIRIESVFPREEFIYVADEGRSALGQKLGEEEWLIRHYDVSVDNTKAAARFAYRFEASRHIFYYTLRLAIPVLLIIGIAFFTFFLKDYGKRIDMTAGNLLLFIAFNFAISSDLPRLGYMTLADMFLIVTFIVGAFLVAFNVVLKRMETLGHGKRAERIDNWTVWLYPFAYVVPMLYVYTQMG